MRDTRIRRLAEQHGIKTTKRLWVEDAKTNETRFLDVPRPTEELEDELVAKGIQT